MAEEVAGGVYRLGAELVSWYAVEDGGRITLVDAGNPNQYDQLPKVLSSMDKTLDDVDAIVLTHAHGDHLGSSARIKDESGAEVRVHGRDEALARGEAEREYERHWVRDLTHLAAWRSVVFFVRGGAHKAIPITDLTTFTDGETLDVPGRLRVIHTPGHTDGSCCFMLTDRRVLFSGDSLVTLNFVTGETGPRVLPGSFNKNSAEALDSLKRLKGIQADITLPGHGKPWRGGVDDAVELARNVGPS